MREGKELIEQRHLEEAIDKVILGEKLDWRPTDEDLRRVAIHEAGHAIVGECLRPGSVASITISPRGQALGYVRNAPKDEQYIYAREQLEEEISVLVAGALAEELVSGSRSTGAAEDFERAVHLARRIVLTGISPLGIIDPQSIPGEVLARAVAQTINGPEKRARDILMRYRREVENVAGMLLESERMENEALRRILSRGHASKPISLPPRVAGLLRQRNRARLRGAG
ncbi:MAG: hypothetical protein HPY55_15975 [Firmicutes bacterium]|nr:hypothetical protein [Bacillota bacterium]